MVSSPGRLHPPQETSIPHVSMDCLELLATALTNRLSNLSSIHIQSCDYGDLDHALVTMLSACKAGWGAVTLRLLRLRILSTRIPCRTNSTHGRARPASRGFEPELEASPDQVMIRRSSIDEKNRIFTRGRTNDLPDSHGWRDWNSGIKDPSAVGIMNGILQPDQKPQMSGATILTV